MMSEEVMGRSTVVECHGTIGNQGLPPLEKEGARLHASALRSEPGPAHQDPPSSRLHSPVEPTVERGTRCQMSAGWEGVKGSHLEDNEVGGC